MMVSLTCLILAAVAILLQSGIPVAAWPHRGTGKDDRIKNIVVLMMENRSFDHYIGFVNSSDTIDNLVNHNARFANRYNTSDPKSDVYFTSPTSPYVTANDPGHGLDETSEQIYGHPLRSYEEAFELDPTMAGFVQNYAKKYNINATEDRVQRVVQAFDPERIPVTEMLVKEYVVMDRYFASFPGSTMPNRLYLHAATSEGEEHTGDIKHYISGYSSKTVFNQFDHTGVTWKNYYAEIPSTLIFRHMRNPAYVNRFKTIKDFVNDARKGRLPNYSFLDPNYGSFDWSRATCNDNHPPCDVRHGEMFLKQVYDAVRQSPQWNETLLVITYDEHGGFFDHVTPPQQDIPNPDGKKANSGFNFDRLGSRVPTILVSPWVKKGGVIHDSPSSARPSPSSQYDHTSIMASAYKYFGLTGSNTGQAGLLPRRKFKYLTKRDAWASTFNFATEELDSIRVDCPESAPLGDLDAYYEDVHDFTQNEKMEAMDMNMELSSEEHDIQESIVESTKRDFEHELRNLTEGDRAQYMRLLKRFSQWVLVQEQYSG